MTINQILNESYMVLNQTYIGSKNKPPEEFMQELEASEKKFGKRNKLFSGKKDDEEIVIYNTADGNYLIRKINIDEQTCVSKKVDKINIKKYEDEYKPPKELKVANNPDISVKLDYVLVNDLKKYPNKKLFYQDGFNTIPITGYHEPNEKEKMLIFNYNKDEKEIAKASNLYNLIFKYNGYTLYFKKEGKTKRIRRYEIRQEGIVFYAQR